MASFAIYKHVILDTVQASGQDVTAQNQMVHIEKFPWIKFTDVLTNGVKKETAITSETLGVVTFTVAAATPAFSTVYSLNLQIENPAPTGTQDAVISKVITITTPAVGTLTPTTVSDQFRAAINAQLGTYVLATGTTTLIVTALAGYPFLSGGWAVNPDASTVVQTTLGIEKRGTPTYMAYLGVGDNAQTIWASGTRGTLAGSAYTLYAVQVANAIGTDHSFRANQLAVTCLWINESATNASTLVTDIDGIMQGFDVTTGGVQTTVNDAIEVL